MPNLNLAMAPAVLRRLEEAGAAALLAVEGRVSAAASEASKLAMEEYHRARQAAAKEAGILLNEAELLEEEAAKWAESEFELLRSEAESLGVPLPVQIGLAIIALLVVMLVLWRFCRWTLWLLCMILCCGCCGSSRYD